MTTREPLKLGIAGLGTVGTGLLQLLEAHGSKLADQLHRPVEVVAVSARNQGKDRGVSMAGMRWTDDPVALAGDPGIDCFVELIGGEDGVAKRAVEVALTSRKHVVTANKALLAHHGFELAQLAEKHNVALNFEAAVAGGIPAIKTVRESLVGNQVRRVSGILNGTCNYILSKMQEERRPFADVLKEAQAAGYAEADPTFDIEGHDTAQKLAILASLTFGIRVDPGAIYVEGITSITTADLEAADQLGYRIKLLGVAVKTDQGIEQRVHPTFVPKDSAIAQVMGVTNAVTIDAEGIAPITLVGPGAGGMATASAVVADIADIARGVRAAPFGRPQAKLTVSKKAPMQRHEGGYYIRMLAVDKPGTAATIAKRLAQHNISMESIVQRHSGPPAGGAEKASGPVPVILITYATTEDAVRKALAAVQRDKVISGRPQLIRIEKN